MNRRLAAIFVADVVGYSRLMEADETGTLAALKERRKTVLEPVVRAHGGRIVKVMGDGVLVEFASAVSAVAGAVELQQKMVEANEGLPEARRIVLRIGINLGDVIGEGADIYGDGVNIAARLEELAEPGGICLSAKVHEEVRGKIDIALDDMGEQHLKNFDRAVRTYRARAVRLSSTRRPTLALPDRPSVAVLPFQNMSGDPEQEYFSDGITEDIITDLSKIGALAVAARNTTFALKGRAMDVSDVARQLRVSHVLEGSVRKAGARVRITAQLIDGATGHHLWAERYDRDLNDIFALQDEIARAIADALKIQLMPAESAGLGRRTTENVEAYQYYLMGRQYFLRLGRRNQLSARRLYRRAIEVDPDYALARAGLALAEGMLLRSGDPSASLATLRVEAERALAMDQTLAEAHVADALVHFHNDQIELAIAACRRAITLEPNLYEARQCLGDTLRLDRKFAEAARAYEKAAEVDKNSYSALVMLWDCRRALGEEAGLRFLAEEMLARAEKAMQLYPDDAKPYAMGCHALYFLGLKERSLEWAERAITIDPEDYNSQYNVACFFAQIGAIEKAIDSLESCVPRISSQQLKWMAQDADMNPLRNHPRYQALIEREQSRLADTESQSNSESQTTP